MKPTCDGTIFNRVFHFCWPLLNVVQCGAKDFNDDLGADLNFGRIHTEHSSRQTRGVSVRVTRRCRSILSTLLQDRQRYE
jgi:hypothetical protein